MLFDQEGSQETPVTAIDSLDPAFPNAGLPAPRDGWSRATPELVQQEHRCQKALPGWVGGLGSGPADFSAQAASCTAIR